MNLSLMFDPKVEQIAVVTVTERAPVGMLCMHNTTHIPAETFPRSTNLRVAVVT